MKKKYIRPTVALIPLDSPSMLAASGIGEGNNPDGGCAKRNSGFYDDDDVEDEGPGEWEYIEYTSFKQTDGLWEYCK